MVTLSVVLVGFVLAVVIQGTIATRDVIGSIISAVLLAYLVHLWIMPSDDDSANR